MAESGFLVIKIDNFMSSKIFPFYAKCDPLLKLRLYLEGILNLIFDTLLDTFRASKKIFPGLNEQCL